MLVTGGPTPKAANLIHKIAQVIKLPNMKS